jgi:hypothetical protein
VPNLQEATVSDVKKFFEYPSIKAFRDEWDNLSEADQTFFKAELTKVKKDS